MNFCDELARNKDPVPIVGIGCTRALANTGRITILFQGFVSEFAMMRSPRRWAGPCVLISFTQSERELTGERILQKANSRAGQDLVLRFPALQRAVVPAIFARPAAAVEKGHEARPDTVGYRIEVVRAVIRISVLDGCLEGFRKRNRLGEMEAVEARTAAGQFLTDRGGAVIKLIRKRFAAN